MAQWSKKLVQPEEINNGREFTKDDDLTVAELNSMVNNSFYASETVESLTSQPNVENANNVGVANVSIETYTENGETKQRFKFENLKGATGATGATGQTGNDGRGIVNILKTSTQGHIDTYTIYYTDNTTSTFSVTNGAKGDKGDTGDVGKTGERGERGVGISTITKTGTSGLVDTYTITYDDGRTSFFTIRNGDEVELRVQGGYFEYKYKTSNTWIRLTSISSLVSVDDSLNIDSANAISNGAVTAEFTKYATIDEMAKVAMSGSYNDLSNKPSLASVATSGSYNDLSNKPTIPTIPTNYVTTDTEQTISGIKTFSSVVYVPDVTIS